jgi:hypothetical protein
MHRTLKVALGGTALSVGVVVGLPGIALASAPDCTDGAVAARYAAVCVPAQGAIGDNVTAPGSAGGTTGGGTAGGSVSSGRGSVGALPFTGDEILVLGLAGAAALAAGSALTVAGRRRGAATA